jgi:hypothetical protein
MYVRYELGSLHTHNNTEKQMIGVDILAHHVPLDLVLLGMRWFLGDPHNRVSAASMLVYIVSIAVAWGPSFIYSQSLVVLEIHGK